MLDFVRYDPAATPPSQSLRRDRFLTGQPDPGQDLPDITWHGVELEQPGWDDRDARALAFTLAGIDHDEPAAACPAQHVRRMPWTSLSRPPGTTLAPGRRYRCRAGSHEPEQQPDAGADTLRVAARSVIVLEALPG